MDAPPPPRPPMLDPAAALAASPLFRLLGRVELSRLAGQLEEVALAPDAVLFREGEPGDAFYVVRSGQAEIWTGARPDPARPILVGPGGIIGEMAILTGEARSASVRAFSALALWRMPAERFLAILERERPIALAIERALSRRLVEANRRVRDGAALARSARAALAPEAWTLYRRLARRPSWSPPAAAAIAADAGAHLEEVLALGTVLKTPDGGLTVLPALVGVLAGEEDAADRAWFARLSEPLAGTDAPAPERIALALLAGEVAAAARLMRAAGPDLAMTVPEAERQDWLVAVERADPALAPAVAAALLVDAQPAAPPVEGALISARAARHWARLLPGLGLSAALVAAAWLAPPPADLGRAGLATVLSAAAMLPLLLSGALPHLVVAFLLAGTLVVSGLVPAEIALSGFATPAWLMLLMLFAIGATLARSGLTYRLALMMLRHLPGHLLVQAPGLILFAVLLSMGVPGGSARVALAAPAVRDLVEAMGLPPRSPAAAFLGLVSFHAFACAGALVVTASATGLLLFGLLPAHERADGGWLVWLIAAAVPHALLFALYPLVLLLALRPALSRPVDRGRIAVQLRLLGPLTRAERLAILAVLLLALGFATRPFHGLADPWVALAVLTLMFLDRALDQDGFERGVEWGLVLFFGVVMGLGRVFAHVGADRWLVEAARPLLAGGLAEPITFLAGTALAAAALRLILPWTTAAVVLALAVLPLAPAAGVPPMLALIAIMVASDHSALPVLNEAWFALQRATEGRLITARQAQLPLLAEALLRLAVVPLSLPVWRWMGLV